MILQHQTPAQFLSRLRDAYASAQGSDVARLATRMQDWITAGDFTEAQVRQAFGLTLAQWAPLKARMITLRTQYQAVQAARGE